MPIGKFDSSFPTGTEMAGIPARLAAMVQVSARYSFSGLSVFRPCLGAVVGATGVRIASTVWNAVVKSFLMRVLTFCAFS